MARAAALGRAEGARRRRGLDLPAPGAGAPTRGARAYPVATERAWCGGGASGGLGRVGRGPAPGGAGEHDAEAARLGAVGQPPGAVVPAGQALALEPAAGEGGVLARDREVRPVGAGAAGAADQDGAFAHAADPDAVAGGLGVGLDQDRPVGEHAGVVPALDGADLGGEPVCRVQSTAVVKVADGGVSDRRNSFFLHALIVPELPLPGHEKPQVSGQMRGASPSTVRPSFGRPALLRSRGLVEAEPGGFGSGATEARAVGRVRRDLVVLLASLAVFAICAVVVADGRVGPAERAVFHAVNGLPGWLYRPMLLAQYLGVLAMPLVVVVPLKLALERVPKQLVQRERPGTTVPDAILRGVHPGGLSFTSGHAIITFAIAGLLVLVLPRRWGVVAVLLASLNAVARVYLGAHNPLDVVGGAAIGLGLAAVLDLVFDVAHGRRGTRRVQERIP